MSSKYSNVTIRYIVKSCTWLGTTQVTNTLHFKKAIIMINFHPKSSIFYWHSFAYMFFLFLEYLQPVSHKYYKYNFMVKGRLTFWDPLQTVIFYTFTVQSLFHITAKLALLWSLLRMQILDSTVNLLKQKLHFIMTFQR